MQSDAFGMLALLYAFSFFNLFAAAGCLGHGVRLLSSEERAEWRSKRLLAIAAFLFWTFPLAALGASVLAWQRYHAGQPDGALIVLAPLGWLILLGIVFAVVNVAEDGRFDFGRGER
jgi:hypothetical protein